MSVAKVCRVCKKEKPLNEFYKHSGMADGHLNACKECKKTYQRRHRKENIEYYRRYDRERAQKPKRKAMSQKMTRRHRKKHKRACIAHNVIKRADPDKLPPRICVVCGRTDDIHYHHDDYKEPLDVVPLCPVHHRKLHMATSN